MWSYSGALRTGSTKIAAKIGNIFGIDSKKHRLPRDSGYARLGILNRHMKRRKTVLK